jgi:hypothetical protein
LSYTNFIRRHRHLNDCFILVVYIAEAHFVEKKDDKIIDGWPVGYFDYEFPQHKSINDRLEMVTKSISHKGGLQFLSEADAILCDNMNNEYLNHFGAWPDSCHAFKGNQLIFKGQVNGGSMYGGGFRLSTFAEQLEEFLQEQSK